jgi:hypothetical protein
MLIKNFPRSRLRLQWAVQFPPPPPEFPKKFRAFSGTYLGGVPVFPLIAAPQTRSKRGRDQRSEKVIADVPSVALLDHLNGRSAVFRKPSLRFAPSDNVQAMNVCHGTVEFPWPDSAASQTPEPDALRIVVLRMPRRSTLRPPRISHRLSFPRQEQEFFPVRMKPSRQSLQEINEPQEHPVS